jgi:hypothetical protein
MRKFGVVAGCVGLAMLASGCDPNDRMYFRGGVGTDLYTPDAALSTDLQNAYLENLCRQSLPFVGAGVPSCSQQELSPTAWPLIVQAGMNDVDQRCDAYLAWLDQKKREQGAILAEIGAIRVAVDALTNPAISTGISPIALAAVAAAFGLATSTLGNVNSLLIQVDHTTVQSVVFMNRRNFREDIRALAIVNKPTAVHALRSYLQICMPMTIAANINSTVTVFQSTGPGVAIRPMVSPPVAPPIAPVVVARPVASAPVVAREKIRVVERAPMDVVREEYAEILDPYDPKVHSPAFVSSLQMALCVPDSEIGTIGPATKALIAIFEASPHRITVNNGKLDANEISQIRGQGRCVPGGGRNYFEKSTYTADADGADAVAQLVAALNKVPGGAQLPTGTSLDGTRARIQQVRADPAIGAKLKLQLPPVLSNQVTRDFLLALPR